MASGDQAALRELYAIYGQRLYAYALRLTGSATVAEDVVQDVLVAAWKGARRYRGEGRVIAWLLGIVQRTALKAGRHESQPMSAEMEQSLVAPDSLPEERVELAEQAEWLQQRLQSLSRDHRLSLELVFYQGLSLKEAAAVCGCPVGTIKSRLSYARRYLRDILQDSEQGGGHGARNP